MTAPHTLRLGLRGARFELNLPDEELHDALKHLYRPFVLEEGEVGNGDFETHDGMGREFENLGDAVFELDELIEKELLRNLQSHLRIHAAAVEGEGHTVLLVGPSGSGKTTLALELVRRGYRYLTDEFTIIDPDATLLQPFPRGATRKFEGTRAAGTNLELSDSWGYRSYLLPDHRANLEPRPLLPRWIIFPTQDADAEPAVEALEPGPCCAQFLPSIFDFEGAERAYWPPLSKLVAGSRACVFRFREAGTDLDLALDYLKDAA